MPLAWGFFFFVWFYFIVCQSAYGGSPLGSHQAYQKSLYRLVWGFFVYSVSICLRRLSARIASGVPYLRKRSALRGAFCLFKCQSARRRCSRLIYGLAESHFAFGDVIQSFWSSFFQKARGVQRQSLWSPSAEGETPPAFRKRGKRGLGGRNPEGGVFPHSPIFCTAECKKQKCKPISMTP